MSPQVERILAALSYLIAEAEKLNVRVTQYDLVKSLFLADRSHLNKFGRPITFDNYYAMRHGPVPSVAYNLLKADGAAMRRFQIKELPWTRTEAGNNSRAYYYSIDPKRVSLDALSESDLDELKPALTIVKSLGFGQIRKLTHEDVAYLDAWDDQGDENSSYPMSYSLLFESPNLEMAEDIAFLSKHL